MLTDISLNPKYGNICGYTQNDVETSFLPYHDGVDLERLKNFFNGYNFLKDVILDFLTKQKSQKLQYQDSLYDALYDADLELFEKALTSLFASIPYKNFTKNDIQNFEGFYASVVYSYLQSLAIRIIGEDVTNRGRIDLTCFIADKIYIIEFKVDAQKEGEALAQIKEKNYAQKYLMQSEKIYLLGIEFDSQEKNVSFFEFAIINPKS